MASSSLSTIPFPVGEWFDIEMYYQWTTGTVTLYLWINGELALEQSGVQTRAASHGNYELRVCSLCVNVGEKVNNGGYLCLFVIAWPW